MRPNAPSRMLLLAFLMLTGCHAVHVRHPVGDPLATDPAETAEQLDGTWANEEGETLQFKYLPGGKLRAANLDWDEEKQEFTKNGTTLLLTTIGETHYLNLKDNEAPVDRYSFARYDVSGSNMIIWTPRVAAFEKAVSSGKLAGTVEKKDRSTIVQVTAAKAEVDAFIDPDRFSEQFEADTPIVLRRLK